MRKHAETEKQQRLAQNRQWERIRLFRMAQGHVPWYCHKASQVILAVLGLIFVIGGFFVEGNVIKNPPSSDFITVLFGLFLSLGGFVLVVETLVVLPQRLKQLSPISASVLKNRLLVEEFKEYRSVPICMEDSQGQSNERKA